MNTPGPEPLRPGVTRVVAGVDDSDLAQAVARAAAVEASLRDVPLDLVHVVGEHHAGHSAGLDPVLRHAALVVPTGVRSQPHLRPTHLRPADALVHDVTASDLLVVGTGRIRATWGAVLGSTCVRVLRHAPGPVLVVRSGQQDDAERERQPVFAAVGLDDDQDAVVGAAFDEAAARGLALRIVHSSQPGDFASVFGVGPAVAWSDLETHAHLLVNAVIDRETARHPDVDVRVTVSSAAATDLLIRSTRTASLLVVGHRAHGGLIPPSQHLTRAMLRHAETSVLSVPVPARSTALQATS